MLALATGAKFIPGALVPLFARGAGNERGWRPLAGFGAAFAAVLALPILLYLPDGGVREFWDTTVGFQLSRFSVFSMWGLHPGLGWLQDVLKLAALALAALVAFFPRGRRSPAQVAALGAAVLIAVQLPAIHWFYFYVAWFMPFVLVALLAAYTTDEPVAEPSARVEPAEPPAERVPVAA
jgi:hypothetical protein